MQLTLKTLTRKIFNVEVDSDKSVADLKLKIEKEHGSEFPADRLKLILKGKILDNEQIINTLSYVEKSFILLMVIKDSQTLSKTKIPEKTDTPKIILNRDVIHNFRDDFSLNSANGLMAISTDESSGADDDDDDDLNESANDVLSTVELLIKFPDDEDMGDLMEQFQERLNEDPTLLQKMIEDIGNNPELSQIMPVDSNVDEEWSDDSHDDNDEEAASENDLDEDSPADSLTKDDVAKVESITAMGFDEERAVEAYLVCGKDVAAAINFLLSHTE